MRILYSILFILITCNLFSQKIELFGGINKNKFFDFGGNSPHFASTYYSDYSLSAGFGIDSVKLDWLFLKFTMQYDNYKGKLNASGGGLGGSFNTRASVNKSILSLGIFPVNFKVFKRINFSLGVLFSRLINESFTGITESSVLNNPTSSSLLQDQYDRYSSKSYTGIQGSISYDIRISKSIWISPQYSYYFGLRKEFREFPSETKAMRQILSIGIKKKFK